MGVHSSPPISKSLRLSEIKRQYEAQPRPLNNRYVAEYAADMKAGNDDFPPVTVFFDGKAYWLADGFHRVAAAKLARRKTIQADVRKGGLRDAILHSCGANATHGYRRTNEEKKRAVEKLLEDEEWRAWNDSEIARHAKVDRRLVKKIREKLSCTDVQDASSGRPTKVTRKGKTYVQQTGSIGSRGACPDFR